MLKRKITEQLLEWKNNPNKMPLVIKGARQVGKTFIINKFCEENYKNYIYINFDLDQNLKKVFEGNLDVDTIIKNISILLPNSDILPNETIIFFDEIQNCPNARTSLKSFAIDRRFDVIASGSLLGLNCKDVTSFPVGYNDQIEMFSLDFEEFLWANNFDEESIKYLKEFFVLKKEVPRSIHEKMLALFREYVVIGGMPRVVSEYVNTKDYGEVLRIQRAIVSDYLDDIAKYASGTEKVKARECFLSIPKHLSRDYKKFRYSLVNSNASSRKYEGSLMWLYDSGIINYCYNLTVPELPLEGNAKSDAFKIYMKDTGLLVSMLEDGSQKDILMGNIGIYKGALYENIIADIFTKLGKKLYYFEYKSQLEIDFFIRYNDIATAIEVKSADNTKSKSMRSIMENWNVKQGIKLSSKNIGFKNNLYTIPIYMAMFLK